MRAPSRGMDAGTRAAPSPGGPDGSVDGVIEVTRRVQAPPAAVWGVLSNGWLYPSWVVGAARMRAVDPRWPDAGTSLHHSAGVWPVLLSDSTTVLESEPGRRLLLQARGWPVGEARVELRIEPAGAGHSDVTIVEDVTHGVARALPARVRQLLLGGRNTETLKRLAFLAEEQGRPTPGGAEARGRSRLTER